MNPNHNPSLDPLMSLLGQAERERDDSASQLHREIAASEAAQAQVDQLVAYRGEYEARFREQFSRNGSISILQCYQGFSSRLSQAIDQQKQVADNTWKRVERARVALREQEMRVASTRKLLERRLGELRQAGERAEQKQTDELAARAAWGLLQKNPLTPAV